MRARRWTSALVEIDLPCGTRLRVDAFVNDDDTTVPVLAPGTGKTRTGRLWVVVRDERPFGSDIPPAAYYRYSPDHKGIHAQVLLGRCRGFLHADGYAGFDSRRSHFWVRLVSVAELFVAYKI